MIRYLYYLLFVNMISNMVASVPRILLSERTDGALLSMLLSIPFGLLFIYIFTRFFSRFPEKSLPDILNMYFSRFFSIPLLILCILVWFVGGLITLVSYTFMLKRFLLPDMSLLFIAICFLIFVSYGIFMLSNRVLYTIEAALFVSLPLMFYLIYAAFTNEYFIWDFARESFTYIYKRPNYHSFSASLYLFVGVANLIIFNQSKLLAKIKLGKKQLFFIGAIGIFALVISYIGPIGMNGFDHIEELIYPAIFTSDTLLMKFGIVARTLYIFLLFFLPITFLSILIHWHVAIEICKKVLWFPSFQWKKVNLTPLIYLVLFWVVSLYATIRLDEFQLFKYIGYFFQALPIIFTFMFIVFWVIKRRAHS